MRLNDYELESVPDITVESMEETILSGMTFTRNELDALDLADRCWLLRETLIRVNAVSAKLRAELAAAMTDYMEGSPDARATIVTTEEVVPDLPKLRAELPDFWEQFSYIPASEAQRMHGRVNQRDCLRSLYGVEVLPEERIRVQDMRDFLPSAKLPLYLRGTGRITGTYLLLRDSDDIDRGTQGQPPHRQEPDVDGM